ncbi:hypothetical protein MMC25_003117 [Agyrium rufum]|nr:hypothetical protein [Agyrium rufum]
MSGNLLSYAGWTVLPGLVTGWIQTIYYGFTIRAGDPKPQPGTPRFIKHRRRIFIIVVLAYLLYDVFETDHNLRLAGDFYQSLGVPHEADERSIKSRFRRLAALHHPDKATGSDVQAANDYFVHLKEAQDTLLNPNRRFAYDRFGPDVLKWKHCLSIRDYLLHGFQVFAPMYAGSGAVLILLGVAGYVQWGKYWRYLTFAMTIVLETYTLTRPYPPPFLQSIINPVLIGLTSHPPLLPFQFLILARKTALTFFIALTQLAPLFQSPASASTASEVSSAQILRLEQYAAANDAEASRLLALDMAPLAGDESGTGELKGRVRDWLVQNTIRADPEVRDAMGRTLARRRATPG